MDTIENSQTNADVVNAEEVKPKVKLSERLPTYDKFKDKSYESEDDAVSDAISYMEELSQNSKSVDEFKQNFMKVIDENPILDYIIKSIKETGSLQASLQSLFDNPEDMLLKEGDEGYESVQE